MVRKVFVDKELCIGCMACSTTCPDVFVIKEDPEHDNAFKSFTKDDVNHEEFADTVQQAIDVCPVQAIKWEEK